METAPHKNIHDALLAVRAEVGAVGKDGRNLQQGWVFRGVDQVVNAVAPVMIRHGINTEPNLDSLTYRQIEIGSNRSLVGHALVEVTYSFTVGHDSVKSLARVPGEAMDSGDKAVSKAMSVAYRTALLQALMLPTGEPDPDEETYERSPIEAPVLIAGPSWHRRILAASKDDALKEVYDDAVSDGLRNAVIDRQTGLTIAKAVTLRLETIRQAKEALAQLFAEQPSQNDPPEMCIQTPERAEALAALAELSTDVPGMVWEAYGLHVQHVSTQRLVALAKLPGVLPSAMLAESQP